MADRTQMLSSWSHYLDDASHDVGKFYSSIEAAITRRRIPDIRFARRNMKEGGVFSASREYLIVMRDDMRYDIYGAPFAWGFFVSSRLFAEGQFADAVLESFGHDDSIRALAGALTARLIGANTYYKFDTARMFLHLAHEGLLEAVDQLAKGTNQPAVPPEQRKPVLQGYFQ